MIISLILVSLALLIMIPLAKPFLVFKFPIPIRNLMSTVNADAATKAIPQSNDEHFMKLAIRNAQAAYRMQEIPIGAIIVDNQGNVLSGSG